jgi:hypothetical protein
MRAIQQYVYDLILKDTMANYHLNPINTCARDLDEPRDFYHDVLAL